MTATEPGSAGRTGSAEAGPYPPPADAAPMGSLDSLELFGSLRIHFAGSDAAQPLEWHKPVALLAYLACRPGWHSRETLAERMRPGVNEQAGKAYLRGLLHRTRELFPQLGALEVEDRRVRWSGDSDVGRFEQAIARGEWKRAIALQEQPLLVSAGSIGEPALDDWFHEERLRLRQRLGSALVAQIVEGPARGDRSDLMQKLVDLDPLDESVIQILLTHARSALERHVAAAGFQTLKRRLAAEYGQAPLDTTQDLYATMQGQLESTPGSPAAPQPPRARAVPEPLGRVRELEELAALLLGADVRLLTIHGPGGVGKTSVARALHASLGAGAGGPALWVDLRAVDSLHGMLDAIAGQTGMVPHDGPLEGQLASWLSRMRPAVFLDNFEQLSAHAGVLERLSHAARGARFVVTSREALGLRDEHLYGLSGLPCHGEDSAAARLFEVHATRMGHAVTAEEKADVRRLVEYLEGLPLAIELAANWVTLLPVNAILAELRDNPAFIDGARSQGNSRTMQSVFEGMWGRLDEQERSALVTLAVMLGPIDLQTVGARAYGEAGVFLRLVRKSLLQRAEQGLFRVHPLLRRFVVDKAGERAVQDALGRHAHRFLEALGKMPPLRVGRFQPELLARMQPYAQDLVQACRCAVDEGRWELLADALPNLIAFLLVTSRHEILLELSTYAAARAPGDFSAGGELAVARAHASFRLGRMDEAEALARDAMAREPQFSVTRALLASLMSCVRRFYGAYEEALLLARQALESLGDADDPFARMQVQEDLALCHWHLAELPQAESSLLRNMTLANRHDAKYAEATTLCLLGILRSAMGHAAEGLDLLQSSERLFREMQDPYRTAFCQRGMSYVYLQLGDLRRQAEAAEAALATFSGAGYQHEIGESLFAVVVAHDAAGRMQQARQVCREALRRCLQARQVPIALRCIGAMGAFEASEDRLRGLALMSFAAAHPALRRADIVFVTERFAALGATAQELAAARVRAAGWSFQAVCEQLLPGHAEGRAPGGPAG